MDNNKKDVLNDANTNTNEHADITTNENEMNEDRRVKVLSPGMLVVKRFVRNKLAIIGLVILAIMLVFSFIGGLISPYGEKDIFYKNDMVTTQYASATKNDSIKMYLSAEAAIKETAKSKILQAAAKNENEIIVDGVTYQIVKEAEDLYRITGPENIASGIFKAGRLTLTSGEANLNDDLKAKFTNAVTTKNFSFTSGEKSYTVSNSGGLNYSLNSMGDIAAASKYVIDLVESSDKIDFMFRIQAEKAIKSAASTFTFNGKGYGVKKGNNVYILTADGKDYATVSDVTMKATANDIKLNTQFREALISAIDKNTASFTLKDSEGTDVKYSITNKNGQYSVKYEAEKLQYDIYASPSSKHWLGTDGNGMDNLTRLMYGGRISLVIGFVVVLIELLIGILIGGLAGYFGGWVDQLLMRIVDIVICIPAFPLYIILGSLMDTYKVDPQMRIYYLMIVLGILSWPGIARMVRGQILSLREQEFMVATEATGISVPRRIFKHLIPNVIPQLIVIATMDLGGIILTEATLSFLGLGVKFPFASWGNIINAVSNIYVMTNYWFVWIPAGFLILATVMGFNFVGDGLRDAFDPKMKR